MQTVTFPQTKQLPQSSISSGDPGNACSAALSGAAGGNVASGLTDSGDHRRVSNPLGSIAESSSTREESRSTDSPQDATIRWRFKLLKTARKLLPGERIAQCMNQLAPGANLFVAMYNPEHASASYAHLLHCESASCPVCALWKSEQDRRRLSVIMAEGLKQGYYPVMITLTLSHNMQHKLKETLQVLHDAYGATFKDRWYKDLCAEYGIYSKATVYEPTYGVNGWHPHMHILMFMALELAGRWLTDFESKLRERWIDQLQRRGFDASWERGLTVETADSKIADYIAKYGREPLDRSWGADSEMAKAPVKKANRDGFTPLELLAAASGQSEPLERFMQRFGITDRKAAQKRTGALYVEYFEAFRGRARLYIPAKLQLWLKTESAAAALESPEPDSVHMVIGDHECWKEIARRDLEAELLVAVRTGDAFYVMVWLGRHGINAVVPQVALEFSSRRAVHVFFCTDAIQT